MRQDWAAFIALWCANVLCEDKTLTSFYVEPSSRSLFFIECKSPNEIGPHPPTWKILPPPKERWPFIHFSRPDFLPGHLAPPPRPGQPIPPPLTSWGIGSWSMPTILAWANFPLGGGLALPLLEITLPPSCRIGIQASAARNEASFLRSVSPPPPGVPPGLFGSGRSLGEKNWAPFSR